MAEKVCLLYNTYWYPSKGEPKCDICPCGKNKLNTCKVVQTKEKEKDDNRK